MTSPRFQFGDSMDTERILKSRLEHMGIPDAFALVTGYIEHHPSCFRPQTREIVYQEMLRSRSEIS